MYGLARVAGWESHDLHRLAHICEVACVFYMCNIFQGRSVRVSLCFRLGTVRSA